MNKCIIVGACKESLRDFTYAKDDFIIASDGGYSFLKEKGYPVHLVVGDFDSLKYVPSEDNIIKLDVIKDVTDTHEAIEEGIKKGYKDFVLYGCFGGREDHSFASIQELLHFKKRGINIILKGKEKTFEVLMNETKEFKGEGYISVFSLTDVSKGVTLKNLKYELTNQTLLSSFPLGVSNEFIANKKATISILDGCLLIIY